MDETIKADPRYAAFRELVKTHPRVRYLKTGVPCSVMKTRGRKGDYRCKNTAHWRFTALTGKWMTADSGDMCWSHLIHRGLMATMDEDAAFDRWLKRKGWKW